MLTLAEYFFGGVVGLYVVQQLISVFIFVLVKDKIRPRKDIRISLLIAARNEEKNIGECLASIARLDYPQSLLTVHVGDDRSTDKTAEIIRSFIHSHPNFHYHYIDSEFPGLKGKQNVLAHLFRYAEKDGSEIVFVTDADMRLPVSWLSTLAGEFTSKETGMASGPTYVEDKGIFPLFQGFEWMFFVLTNKALNVLGNSISAIGNNMAVLRSSYDKTGGYENLTFSITEDYRLYEHVVLKNKEKFRFIVSPEVLGKTRAARSLKEYFQQRKRWLTGGLDMPFYILLWISFYTLSSYAILCSVFVSGVFPGVLLFSLKSLVDFIQMFALLRRFKKLKQIFYFPVFAFYSLLVALASPFFLLLPSRVSWKSRIYDIKRK